MQYSQIYIQTSPPKQENKTIQNINEANIMLWKCNLDPNTNDRTNAKYVWKKNTA